MWTQCLLPGSILTSFFSYLRYTMYYKVLGNFIIIFSTRNAEGNKLCTQNLQYSILTIVCSFLLKSASLFVIHAHTHDAPHSQVMQRNVHHG